MKLAIRQFGQPDSAADKHLPDVIFIHGTGSSSNMWIRQAGLLFKLGYRSFLMDLRGHGLSVEPGESTDMEVHISDVRETLADLNINYPAIFIGHSLGAMISLMIAERNPELVHSVLAVGMPAKVLKPISRAFDWFLGAPYKTLKRTGTHQRLAWRERTLIKTDLYTLDQINKNISKINLLNRPFKVKCPVHFAVGRFDPIATAYHVMKMHRKIPGSTVRVFEWAGHNCMDQHPKKFNKWLVEKVST